MEHHPIRATPKTGLECLSEQGRDLEYNLNQFWRWCSSDLLSNATRGRFAEFIVGTAIGLSPNEIRNEWDAFDLITHDGIKIEVKTFAYVQSWYQKELSRIQFSIKRTKFWDATTNLIHDEPKRHADIYVFCVLKHKEPSTIDPLKMEQWDFYVLPTSKIDDYQRSKSSMTLKSLQQLTSAIPYSALKQEIYSAFEYKSD